MLTGPQLLPGHAVAAPVPGVPPQHPTRLDHTVPLDASRSTLLHIAQTRPLALAAPAPAEWTPALVPAQGTYGQAPVARASRSAKLLFRLMGSAGQLRAAAVHHIKALAAACVTSSGSSHSQRRLPRKLRQWGLSHLHVTAAPDDKQAALYSRKLLQQDAASPAGNSHEAQLADNRAAGRAWAPSGPASAAAVGTSDSTATSNAQEPGTAAAAVVSPANGTATSNAQQPGTAAAAAVSPANSTAPPQAPDSTASSSAWTALEPGLAAAAGALAASSMPATPLPTNPVASQSPSSLSLGLDMEVRQHKQILIVIGEQSGMSTCCFACMPCLMLFSHALAEPQCFFSIDELGALGEEGGPEGRQQAISALAHQSNGLCALLQNSCCL